MKKEAAGRPPRQSEMGASPQKSLSKGKVYLLSVILCRVGAGMASDHGRIYSGRGYNHSSVSTLPHRSKTRLFVFVGGGTNPPPLKATLSTPCPHSHRKPNQVSTAHAPISLTRSPGTALYPRVRLSRSSYIIFVIFFRELCGASVIDGGHCFSLPSPFVCFFVTRPHRKTRGGMQPLRTSISRSQLSPASRVGLWTSSLSAR